MGVPVKVVSPTPNSVAFKEEYEVPGGFSRTEIAEAELRFDVQTKRYLFNFSTVRRAIQDLVLSYSYAAPCDQATFGCTSHAILLSFSRCAMRGV